MPNFIATVEVTLHITADTREDAKKLIRKWEGASSIGSDLGWMEWNCKGNLKSLKQVEEVAKDKTDEIEQVDFREDW